MRKLIAAAAGAALLTMAVSGIGQADSGPRLSGQFNVTTTIEGNDIGIPPGTVTTDVYTFKPTCGSGGCAKVGLTRRSGGRNFKSTLKKIAPGVYKGLEGPHAYTCVKPLGDPGQSTVENKIKVTKSVDGQATKISGEIKVHITGCTETFENGKLTGKLKG
jgi:hypothetical protein